MRAFRSSLVLALAVAMTAGLLLAGTASAAPKAQCTYNCPPPTAGSSVTNPAAGSSITVSGRNWCPGTPLTIMVGDTKVGTATANSSGTFSTSITIPPGTPAGTLVTVTGLDSGCQNSATRTVATVAAASAGGLPFTGANISRGLVALVALVTLGAVALVASRRRKPAVAE